MTNGLVILVEILPFLNFNCCETHPSVCEIDRTILRHINLHPELNFISPLKIFRSRDIDVKMDP